MPTTPAPATVAVNGTEIRVRRIALGEDLKTFSTRAGMSLSYLSDIERGRRPRVSPKYFRAIRAALGLPASQDAEIRATDPVTDALTRSRRASTRRGAGVAA